MTTESPQSLPKDHGDELGIIWGAKAIGAAIGCNARRVHYMLETGALPGARKVAGRWCITRRRLWELFDGADRIKLVEAVNFTGVDLSHLYPA